MFILHASNKTENLIDHLTTVIETSPLSSPFSKETFLIQSQGMERWLSQQLANYFKVWGNYEFLFPGKFFSLMAQQIDSRLNDQVFAREQILWHLEALLRNLQDEVYAPLQHYIAGENSALKRYQLARQLAQVFDQYQIMRPTMLLEWQQGRGVVNSSAELWQRHLWQQLINRLGDNHRGTLWLQAINQLQTSTEKSLANQLPERIMVFGLNTMPPLFLDFLQGVARHVQVHLYLLNPSQTYWADLENKRQITKQKSQYPVEQQILGHPLLATLGQQGREFQEMLLEQVDFELQVDSFAAEEKHKLSNLQRLQNDILANQLTAKLLQYDGSISIHSCHSRMREVQVMKNQLLQTLETDHSIALRDVVVMAPDIQVYAPFISAVFADIQHAVADRSLRLSNPLLDVFIRFLHLSQSRFGWQEVLDLLDQPAVYNGFSLSETDLDLIKHWVQDTQIRWGKSSQHKAELGLPVLEQNTWQAGLERLLMGYACADDEHFINGTLPYPDIEGSASLALGGLIDFMQLLFAAASELGRAISLQSWGERLYHYADALFSAPTIEAAERRELNELLAELTDNLALIHDDDVTLVVIICWLQEAVQEHKSSTGFLRGQLTFCSMLPMRSIPFKVIALLGLNEGEFPKIDHQPSFDLLSQNFHKGDRSRRADDRYQFLEILLSARKQLIITFIGQSIRQQETIQPSVVISEVLEILLDSYQLRDLVIAHPLQAFSQRYFDAKHQLFSYSNADCQTASSLTVQSSEPVIWWTGEIPADETESSEIIDINDLFAFFRHPQHYFVKRKLSVSLSGIQADPEQREPFAIGGLDAYQINHDWIAAKLADQDLSVSRLQAQGRWLSGVSGEIKYLQQEQDITAFVERIKEKQLGQPKMDLSIDMTVDHYRLVGKLHNLYEQSSLFFRYARLKGKDFLQAWIHHLIINQILPQQTFLFSSDDDLLFTEAMARSEDLKVLLDIYRQGQTVPHAFFVEPALAYILQAEKLKLSSRTAKPAIDAAKEQLLKTLEAGYDAELNLLYADVDDIGPLLDNRFATLCETLLLPIWEAAHAH